MHLHSEACLTKFSRSYSQEIMYRIAAFTPYHINCVGSNVTEFLICVQTNIPANIELIQVLKHSSAPTHYD